MQHSPYEIKEKLLQALDDEYNVVDMVAVLEVITALEKAIITKEALEKTRIGKYINELRKRTNNENLARRAKDLVKSWRKLLPQTPQRINGEDSQNSIITSPGGITMLGPGPGPGYGPGPGPGNRSLKTCVSVPATQRYKTASPSVMIERSSSPYFSSASNSPLLNSLFQGSNLAAVSCSYAPVKFTCHTQSADSGSKLDNNQSKITSNQVFKPISPTVKLGSSLSNETNVHSQTASSNASPRFKNNSSSSRSSSSSPVNVCSPTEPSTLTNSLTHSLLDLNKANVANKRLRKCNNYVSCDGIDLNSSKNKIGNGISNASDPELSEISIVQSVICNSDCVEDNILPNIKCKTPKRRKKNNQYDQSENRLENLLVSITSSSKLPKVKTTRQLIADLHEKGNKNVSNLTSIDALHSTDAEVSRTKSELLQKFLSTSQTVKNEIGQVDLNEDTVLSDSSLTVPDGSAVISTNACISSSMLNPVDEEIKRILSALPSIDPDFKLIDDDSMMEDTKTSKTLDMNRINERWEYVNGVYDCNGDWKTWQECAEQRSYHGESLQILPYVNID